jgi:threonine synthase
VSWRGVVAEYGSLLAGPEGVATVTLLEGNTPLLQSPALSERLGAAVWLKLEGLNPTGSFKDRGMTLAVSRARAQGATTIICASTGNTSASAAAYAAAGGLSAVVLVPEGQVAAGKLAQAVVHGARVLCVRANFDGALTLARRAASELPIALVNSVNPDRLEGQKTAAFEIVDALGDAPTLLAIPVGNAGNITAYGRGFAQYQGVGRATRVPTLWGFQASGAAPMVLGHVVEHPTTVATAIRIGNPASWQLAQAEIEPTGGCVRTVTDEEILAARDLLARGDGVFVEPASAASVAGVLRYGVPAGATVVCVLTGHGLKDPGAVSEQADVTTIDGEFGALVRALG